MQRAVYILIALLTALAVSAALPAHAQTASSLVREGRQIAMADCGACHALGAKGPSPSAQAPPFRDISLRYDPDNLAEALAEGISVGHPAMPERAYPADKIAALLAYLRSLQPMRPHVRPK